MNYLRIENKGLLVNEDLMLIGSSTKRDDHSKIGMFGSGWKYALAWIMRNHLDIKIFSGEEEIKIDTKIVMHREQAVSVITVEGKETSLTTSMGPKWTGWMALRELISNAIDEGEEKIETFYNPNEFISKENTTTIYLEMDKELKEVMRNYDKYFSFEKRADFITKDGHLFYIKEEESIFNIYRKGIRCLDCKRKTLIDVNFRDISINESRLTQESHVDIKISNIICNESLPLEIIVKLLKGKYQDIIPSRNWNNNIKEHCLKLLDAGYDLTTGFVEATKIDPNDINTIMTNNNRALFIPGKWYSMLIKEGYIQSPFSFLLGDNVPEGAIINNELELEEISKLLNYFNININIKSGTWNSSTRIFKDGDIYYIKEGIFTNNSFYSINIQYASLILSNLNSSHFCEVLENLEK